MSKQRIDNKTLFQIFKNGKVSIFVSTLLLSASIGTINVNADIVNGNFEDGLNGWTTNVFGSANPVTLATGTTNASAGTINPSLTADQYVYTSQSSPGLSILSQAFNVTSGTNKLFFDYAIRNNAGSYFTPDSFNYNGAQTQQARFDVLKPGSDPTVYNAGDIIVTGFKTESGDPAIIDWTTKEIDLTADLASYVGQDVILRFWQEDNQGVFNLALDNINVGLTQLLSSYFDQTVAGNGNTPSQRNAQKLDDFVGTGMDDFKTVLDACATDECVASAVDELEVKLAGAGVSAAKQTAQSIAKIVRQRQGTFGLTGGNSGEEMFTEKNFWFKPFGTWGEQNDKDGLAGYDIKSYGFGIGADAINKDDQQLGFGLFYTNADVDVNGVNQNSDVDAFTILGYGSTPIIDNKTKFLYQVGYSWQMTDTFRETLTGDAVADYTSNVASIDLKVMRDYQVNDKWLVQPTVGLSYTYFKAPSYSESGAGVASLDVNKFSTSETLLNIGAVSNYKIDDSSIFITTLDLGYDLENNDDAVTSTTQGGLQLADSESIDNGRISYAIGLGYEKQLNNNSNINFTYEYSGEGSDYSNNTISVKYVINF